ncbi:Ig-like domain-containing protein, partial [Proteus vulgaris]|uniref:Ig-like domain-containing protein n=1 Tax=Proteus vulgaris TaxID=585 RepID=UPI0034D5D0D4
TYVVKDEPKNGTLTLDPNTGDYTYTPNPDFNGEDSFVVTVDDGNGGKIDVPVNVTVTPVNDAPVAGEDDKETPEDTSVSG